MSNAKESVAFAVTPGAPVDLTAIDPSDTGGVKRQQAEAEFAALGQRLDGLQEVLYAAKVNAVLVVLQGLDTAGKDGTVRHVMASVSPQGCRVESFKQPTPDELAHYFLWRVHQVTPARGMITIFNRSHYEDVLVARVHSLVPEAVWRPRYEQINAFESLLAASGTIIVKFFLHINKDEQRQRLQQRQADKDKAWKLSPTDWVERRAWDAYINAYEEALQRCSTAAAPWYVVPADHKWYRNYLVAKTLAATCERYEPAWRTRAEAIGQDMLRQIQENAARREAG